MLNKQSRHQFYIFVLSPFPYAFMHARMRTIWYMRMHLSLRPHTMPKKYLCEKSTSGNSDARTDNVRRESAGQLVMRSRHRSVARKIGRFSAVFTLRIYMHHVLRLSFTHENIPMLDMYVMCRHIVPECAHSCMDKYTFRWSSALSEVCV